MKIFERKNWGKIGVPFLGILLVAVTVYALQFFMNRLLLRDGITNGVRWAENVEASVKDIDKIFTGKKDPAKIAEILDDMSTVGKIYRFEFSDPAGNIVLAFGSYHPKQDGVPAQYHTHNHASSRVDQPNAYHNNSAMPASNGVVSNKPDGAHRDNNAHSTHSTSKMQIARENPETPTYEPNNSNISAHRSPSADQNHSVNLQNGDGNTQPEYFAAIDHPIVKNNEHVGTIRIFLDQTEKYKLFRETIYWLFAIILGVSLLCFGAPSMYYLRSRLAVEKAKANAQFHAHHDSMTQLANRKKFVESVNALLEGQKNGDQRYALHFIDVDNFKSVNDTFGHDSGDELLRQVSDQLRIAVAENHFKARIGCDEFAVLQADVQSHADVEEFARKLQAVFSNTFAINGFDITASASIGTAVTPREGTTCRELMKSADIALYTVKTNGRGGYAIFEEHMRQEQNKHIRLETAIRNANNQGLFEVYFQPLFVSKTSRLSGFEALIRLKEDDGEYISPDDFIPVAEEMGLMTDIGKWVLCEATKIAASWPDHLILAVNLSIKQFEHGDLVEIVEGALKESGLSPTRLELEITEGLIMNNTEWNLDQLHRLKNLGISIVMDDFGTGYSSLGYLWKFPFDKIKIDQSFLRGLDDDPDTAIEIIKTIITLGHSLKIVVTAEGVETDDQLSMLCDMDCDFIQGFLLGKPHPIEHIAPFLIEDFYQMNEIEPHKPQQKKRA